MSWYVIYCKVIETKDGIQIRYPFIGGETPTEVEAEALAKKIVSKSNQCVVIPRIFEKTMNLPNLLKQAESKFEKMAENMYESHAIMNRKK